MAPSNDFLRLVSEVKAITSEKKGTFANDTFSFRLPKLIRQTVTKNEANLTSKQVDQLEKLAKSLESNEHLLALEVEDPNHPVAQRHDTKKWIELWEENKHLTWQNAPWFYAEIYMFRLVLQRSGFYDTGLDPYHYL
jgi:hypothetical protein